MTLPLNDPLHLALVKTCTADAQGPVSADTASAINSEVKTRNGEINIWASQDDQSSLGPQNKIPCIFAELSESPGMATGIVTATRVFHARPVEVYGHGPCRDRANDKDIPLWARLTGCMDLVEQWINFPFGNGIDVIPRPCANTFSGVSKVVIDPIQKNLIQASQCQVPNSGIKRKYIDQTSHVRIMAYNPKQVLGLMHPVTLAGQQSLTSLSQADDVNPYTSLGYLHGPNIRAISNQPL